MKKRTRLLSVLLTLVMVLGLVPAMSLTANAYSGAGTKSSPYVVTDYDELRELLRSKTEDDPTCYIRLGGDITDSSSRNSYTLSIHDGADIVLDLAGHSLTRSGLTTDSYLFAVCGASLTVNDSVGGGDITARTSTGGPYLTGAAIWVQNWSKSRLTINGGTFAGGEYGIVTEGGTTVINSGTILSLNPEINSFVQSTAGYFRIGTVIVNGGAFGNSTSVGDSIVIRDTADVTLNNCTAYCAMYSADRSWPSIKSGTIVTLNGTETRPKGNYYSDRHVGDKYVISTSTPKTTIGSVAITGVDAPAAGKTPDTAAVSNTTGVTTYGNIAWYKGAYTTKEPSESSRMAAGEKFQTGETYTARAWVSMDRDKYRTSADCQYTVNGQRAYSNNFSYEENVGNSVWYTFPALPAAAVNTISTVAITNLDALKHGQAADYTASTSTPGCTVEKVEYQMFRKTLTDYVPSDGDNVAVVVTVSAADGYAFASGSTATWNGLTSDDTVAGLNANEKRYAFYIEVGADASQIVKSAAMTVTAPQIGKAPAATVTAPQGVTVESVAWTPADSAFKEGVSYTVKIGFQADSTHVLADDFLNTGTVTINGQSAQLSKPTTGGIKDTFLTTCYASFTFPALKAGEQPVSPDRTNPFTDVKESDYFYNPVLWAVEKEVTNGTSATTFSPANTCTRAQIITFLWRASGSPEPGITCSFLDVPAGSYYEKAVTWATEQGMVEGDKFYPNDPCTRLMAVEFMWAQAGRPDAPAASFEDVNSPAVDWAVEAGVTNGTSATTFSPDSTCTRGQIVTFLWRAFG